MTIEAKLFRAHGALTTLSNGRHAWHSDIDNVPDATDLAPDPHDLLDSALAACTAASPGRPAWATIAHTWATQRYSPASKSPRASREASRVRVVTGVVMRLAVTALPMAKASTPKPACLRSTAWGSDAQAI